MKLRKSKKWKKLMTAIKTIFGTFLVCCTSPGTIEAKTLIPGSFERVSLQEVRLKEAQSKTSKVILPTGRTRRNKYQSFYWDPTFENSKLTVYKLNGQMVGFKFEIKIVYKLTLKKNQNNSEKSENQNDSEKSENQNNSNNKT